MSRQYRPHHASSSPLWQCLHDSLESFTSGFYPDRSKYLGPLDPSRETALRDSLRCGDLASGFLRVQCPDCDHHYLLPFTCKRRGCCPSCHQRRALDTAAFIRNEVCLPVPHRHWVFTLPRVLRNVFRKDPHRLTELCHLVAHTLQDWLREQAGLPDGRAGIVLAIHTFGDYLVYHPHIHCLATAGVFDNAQNLHLIRSTGCQELAQLFRHRVLHRLLELKWISPRQADKLLSWHHHGFNIDQGEAAIGADDGKALERLSQYFLRAPVSLQKMHWNAQTKSVLYRSARSWRTKRNFELFSGPDFVAALYEHVPPKGFQTLRYYGTYSSKARGMRKKTEASTQLIPQTSSVKLSLPARHKRLWRERIFAIWGCDPLNCPCCGSEMRPHKPVQGAEQIRRQLKRLGLWEPITLTKACTPRAPPSTVRWILDAHDGTVIDLEPEAAANWMPTAPRYKRERSEPVGVSETANPQAVEIQPLDDGFLLEIEDSDPWAQDNEPIFWTD
ncbi:MAG: transposase [Puniceicoccaceae bacterium]|nr:transposase [Puniceicoccaceae bacterium]